MRTIIIVGKEEESEYYALSIGKEIAICSYEPSKGDHEDFIKKTARDFAKVYSLLRRVEGEMNEVDLWNGYRISENGKPVEINKLEDTKTLVSEFSETITRLLEGRSEVIKPAAHIN